MDNLCHTLAGATLGEAGLKRRTAFGMATLMLASNLPDIDVAVFATDAVAVSVRRGWTHGVLAMAVLPALFAGAMFGIARTISRAGVQRVEGRGESPGEPVVGTGGRRDARGGGPGGPRGGAPPLSFKGLLLLSYAATWLHVFMDWLNSYGVRLLMPFSNRWFYGDALYIVDPVLYVVFGVALVTARRAARAGANAPWRPARIGLAVAGAYIALMVASNWWARAEVRSGLVRAGREDARFMVTPVFGNPFRREVIVDTGDRYEKGALWFDPLPHFRPLGYGAEINASDPAARAAGSDALISAP